MGGLLGHIGHEDREWLEGEGYEELFGSKSRMKKKVKGKKPRLNAEQYMKEHYRKRRGKE